MKFSLIKTSKDTNARLGLLEVNGKKIKTPILFHGTILNGKPEPWIYFKERHPNTNIRGLMINAYEIISNQKYMERVYRYGIHKFLKFNGIVFMDSGGFLIQKNQDFDIDVNDVIDVYKKSSPDLIVSLDYPLSPSSSHENNLKNWEKTLENYEVMRKIFPNIMPVIHGYTKEQIENACDTMASYDPKFLGLGSLVPLMRSIKGTKNLFNSNGFSRNKNYTAKHYVVDAIKYVREQFPDSFLHVFGIGSASTMHLMFALGVDSIDSMGWRLKAAYGAVQLPYTADRFLSSLNGRRKKRPIFTPEEKNLFNKCKCGIHQEYDYDYIDTKFEPKAKISLESD
ncbi:MAG: hypothetical protein ACTSQE_13415 [Candidatus Heimdallarchaeaceae archaeon]